MSTALTGDYSNISDPTAEAWLADTDLAGDTTAIARLSRAVAPHRHGFPGRRALPLLGPDNWAEMILTLLRARQVPTLDAVEVAWRRLGNGREAMLFKERHELFLRCKSILASDLDSLGEVFSSAVADYRSVHQRGPRWREAWAFASVEHWWNLHLAGPPSFWLIGQTAFGALHRRGWIASNRTTCSLCPGRRFHIRSHGRRVSQMPPDVVGICVARCIDSYHRHNEGCSPDWEHIASEARDPKGVLLFTDSTDALTQQQWLVTAGWVRLDGGGQLCRGERPKANANRRADIEAETDALGLDLSSGLRPGMAGFGLAENR